ncbi:MAG: glycosyltransferase family 4 protein [Gemmataceae bacterium]|nr:glycosyltransferase family 4 protein [Gemmataceae bacterium]
MTALGLLYDDDGYVEVAGRPLGGDATRAGLLGRQVAGQEFLGALFAHGTWEQLVALVRNQVSADTLGRYFARRTAADPRTRGLRLVPDEAFPDAFHPDPPARVVFTPCPPDLRYAWARRHRGGDGYALSGVTHTLCSREAAEWLGELVVGPFEEYDALICTSRSVLRMVRASADAYADYLRERVGGDPRVRMRREVIPLGVDTDRYRPPSPAERAAARSALGVADDEVAVLFVGRLSHHTKAHPFPLFYAADAAARETGRKVHLILAGWAHNQAVFEAFRGAAALAPAARVSFVDGTRPDTRAAVWHAADVFSSLSDNIQETFGLVVVEALASGLPVVATDWDGYRDLVADGETGLLVPTMMIPGATADATTRLVLESHSYELFLAECSQAVAVDAAAAARAMTRLVGDETERRRMGAAARRAAEETFSWAVVIRAYERLWAEQEQTRREVERHRERPADGSRTGLYPCPEVAFEGYPTRWLGDDARLTAAPDAAARLELLLTLPLVTHAEWARHTDRALLRRMLAAADGRSLAELEDVLAAAGGGRQRARATLAWMLKYDLLRPM